MFILSHRGYWYENTEKNTEVAFKRSFDCGFGTETDVRDHHGEIVISHDIPTGNEMLFTRFLHIVNHKSLPLAINIKADGLASLLKKHMQNAYTHDWFVFDMSIPDMRSYLQANIPVFARLSEVEQDPPYLQQISGIWLDAFTNIWYNVSDVLSLLTQGKRVCVVSSELHGREFESLWNMLLPIAKHPGLMICTDYPERAKEYFGGRAA